VLNLIRMIAGYTDLIGAQLHKLNGEHNTIYRESLATNGRNSQHLQNKLSVIKSKIKEYNKASHELKELNEFQKTKLWIEKRYGREVLTQLFDYLHDN